MRKLSICASLMLLALLSACSETAEKSVSESQPVAATTTATITTAAQYEAIIFDVYAPELDKTLSDIRRNGKSADFSIKISSLWQSSLTFNYGYEIVSGLFFRINTEESYTKLVNSDFVKNYISENSDWQYYKNPNGVEFAYINEITNNAYEQERSIFKFYNNGIICTVYIGTKSADGLTALSSESVNNIINTVEFTNSLTEDLQTTTETQTAPQKEPLVFTGNGDTVTDVFTADGCTRIKGEYTGDRAFHAVLYDSEGNYEGLIFSNVGQYTGEKVFKFENGKQYMFEIQGKEGDWKISVE